MSIPAEIFGVETWILGLGGAAFYLALGAYLFGAWARHDEPSPRPWKWGDAPRRAKLSTLDRLIQHAGPFAIAATAVAYALRGLGAI